jgi:hypothetical protein
MNKAKISLLLVCVLGVTGLTQGLSGNNVFAAKKLNQPEIGITVKDKITVAVISSKTLTGIRNWTSMKTGDWIQGNVQKNW